MTTGSVAGIPHTTTMRFLVWFICIVCMAVPVIGSKTSVSFINFTEESANIYWINFEGEESHVGTVEPYQDVSLETFTGHVFAYYLTDSNGENRSSGKAVTVTEGGMVVPMTTPEPITVRCETTVGDFGVRVEPSWSPHGAARYLGLVRMGYFNGCGLNRVVKKFLTQFGISADFEMRTKYRTANIDDDPPRTDIHFQPGYMSYAGSGPNSRSTEVFIVMPGTAQHQLRFFGSNPWETPFGYVFPEDLNVVDSFYSYGDMPPWGEGPDSQKIYLRDGYEYLGQNFPELSYIKQCTILPSEGNGEASQEEL